MITPTSKPSLGRRMVEWLLPVAQVLATICVLGILAGAFLSIRELGGLPPLGPFTLSVIGAAAGFAVAVGWPTLGGLIATGAVVAFYVHEWQVFRDLPVGPLFPSLLGLGVTLITLGLLAHFCRQ